MTSPTVKSVVKAIDAAVTAVSAARERVSDQAAVLAAQRDQAAQDARRIGGADA